MPALKKAPVTSTEADPRWAAVVAKDHRADGRFYYAVKTTGVYCRPSCATRLAYPRNVTFHASPADAEAAGFRACKRCKPKGPSLQAQHAGTIAWACRVIEGAEEQPPHGASGQDCRPQCLSFSPTVQIRDRPDAARLCARAPRPKSARETIRQ